MSQQKKRDRKNRKKRWHQRGGAGMRRKNVPVADPSQRVTGPLATILGVGFVLTFLVVVGVILMSVFG